MAYYTYILRCADGSLYTGITTDLARRLREHAGRGGKGARYTALRPPERYEAAWLSAGRAEASSLENRIKRLTRSEKEKLASGQTQPDPSVYSPVEDLPSMPTPGSGGAAETV